MRLRALVCVLISVPCTDVPGFPQEPGFDRDIASSAEVRPPTEAVPKEGCSTADCHPGVKEHGFLHGPMQVDACAACHEAVDVEQHRFVEVMPQQDLCLSCHEPQHVMRRDFIHEPVQQAECLACHGAHGGDRRHGLVGEDPGTACLNCHEGTTGGLQLQHGTEAEASCLACHEAHSGSRASLLKGEGRSMCLSCHVETQEQLSYAARPHPPMEEDCRLCHDPHATGAKAMLKTDAEALCVSCHEEVEATLASATHPHEAMTRDRSCLNCHRPHVSMHEGLLRQATDTLCFECHGETMEREGGGSLMDMQRLMTESAYVHGPAARGECQACHQVHGGGRERFWREEFSATYAAFVDQEDYALCFACHDRELVLSERTDAVTAFRNGDQNLHYVHGNSRKSRSCNICHDPHAADREHLLRDSYPFGPNRWPLAIGWLGTPTGGTCAAGCHEAFDYDREQAVVHPRRPGNELDWRGRMPDSFNPDAEPEGEATDD